MSKDPFIHQKMITYLGNKRKLIPEIEKIVRSISKGKKLTIFDAFAGSSVVSRLFTTRHLMDLAYRSRKS